jgi:hypothetical protein
MLVDESLRAESGVGSSIPDLGPGKRITMYGR